VTALAERHPVDAPESTPDTVERAVPLPTLPPEFWTATLRLAHIRQAAHCWARSADIALHGVLARLAATRSHLITLDTGIGPSASLNYFAALIGPSGAGKTSGAAVSRELLETYSLLDLADSLPLGSGEGIPESYMGEIPQDRTDAKGKNRVVMVRGQVRNNALFHCDEGQVFKALDSGRQGSTLGPTLRSAWSGADIGQANASADRRRVVRHGTYAMGFTIGFQPATIGHLLADAAGGTPQRFTYVSAIDPTIPDDPPPWPGLLPLDSAWLAHGHQMDLHPQIRAELRSTTLAVQRGEIVVPELDAHRPLMLVKLAGLLALLHERTAIGLEDWRLAFMVLDTSDAVRDAVVGQLALSATREREARDEQRIDFERRKAAESGAAVVAIPRVAANVARHVHASEGPITRKALRDKIAQRDRAMLDAAIETAIDQGWIRQAGNSFAAGESRPA